MDTTEFALSVITSAWVLPVNNAAIAIAMSINGGTSWHGVAPAGVAVTLSVTRPIRVAFLYPFDLQYSEFFRVNNRGRVEMLTALGPAVTTTYVGAAYQNYETGEIIA